MKKQTEPFLLRRVPINGLPIQVGPVVLLIFDEDGLMIEAPAQWPIRSSEGLAVSDDLEELKALRTENHHLRVALLRGNNEY